MTCVMAACGRPSNLDIGSISLLEAFMMHYLFLGKVIDYKHVYISWNKL